MSRRLLNWRILLALFFSVNLALAPAIAEARAGSSYGGRSSSMGSRGSRTYENNGAQPLSRSVTPLPETPRQPGFAPASPSPAYGGGSFFQRHPFLTGLAGGFIGSWLFGHSGYAADGVGSSAGSFFGMLLQLLIIGLLIWLAVRLFRGWAFAGGARGGGGWPPRSAGAAAPPLRRERGRDVNVTEEDLGAFQAIHTAVQEAWSEGEMGRLRGLMTPEMLSYFSEELTRNASQGVRNIVANVQLLQGDVSEAWEEGDLQYATAYLRWRANDYVIRTGRSPGDPDWLVSGDPRSPVEAEEMWTFVRRRGGNWLLSAIQQI
jgi:predicted lipid-binding transport protein (Tim44 family)